MTSVNSMDKKKVSYTKLSKKQQKDAEEQNKAVFEQDRKTNFKEEVLEKIYLAELEKIDVYISVKITKEESLRQRLLTFAEKEKIKENLSYKEITICFPKSTKYMGDRVWHGYDSKYYVSSCSEANEFYAREYNVADFLSTYLNYIKINSKYVYIWFKNNPLKYTLELDNTKPRTYIKGDDHYLNLFSGYKYNKTDVRDEARIERGLEGVKFFWNHILKVWNSGSEKHTKYTHDWICKLISGHKLMTMLYVKGKHGIGKSSLVRLICETLGLQTTVTLVNDQAIMGTFNGPLLGKALCYLDEICHDFEDFKSLYNSLKPYISEARMTYRNLYEKLKELRNITSFIMTGNYDMLKLDDNSKGEDRRIVVCPVKNTLENAEYYEMLKKHTTDPDVAYSLYWYCVDNYREDFDEMADLKLLPITEAKQNMILQSLDTPTLFFKHFANDEKIMQFIKPKDLYELYASFMRDHESKKSIMNKNSFLAKLKDCSEYILIADKRINGLEKTTYVQFNRPKMMEIFKSKGYFDEYDEVKEILPLTHNIEILEEDKQIELCKKSEYDALVAEIKALKEEMKLMMYIPVKETKVKIETQKEVKPVIEQVIEPIMETKPKVKKVKKEKVEEIIVLQDVPKVKKMFNTTPSVKPIIKEEIIEPIIETQPKVKKEKKSKPKTEEEMEKDQFESAFALIDFDN